MFYNFLVLLFYTFVFTNEQEQQLSIVTISRTHEYIFQTLSNIFLSNLSDASKTVHLFVGSPDDSYLENIKHHKQLFLHTINTDMWENLKKYTVHKRAYINYLQPLHWAYLYNSSLILLEDDVKIKYNALAFLNKAIENIKIDNYVIDCYVVSWASKKMDSRFENEDVFQRSDFCCTQCMYYPNKVLKDLFTYMKENEKNNIFEMGWQPYDLQMGNYFSIKNIPILAMKNPIIDHISTISTGLGNGKHRSKNWHRFI